MNNRPDLSICIGFLTISVIKYFPVQISIIVITCAILWIFYLAVLTARKHPECTSLLISIGISGLILVAVKILDISPAVNRMNDEAYKVIRFILLVFSLTFSIGMLMRHIGNAHFKRGSKRVPVIS